MKEKDKEIWRWNVDDVWQTYSSMFQEMSHTDESTNDFQKYHHLSATLLFGGCAIESFLNSKLRIHLKDKTNEDSIFKRLRYTSLNDKLKKWPTEICKHDIAEKVQETITSHLDLRHEVTHRKRKDHSLYAELDGTNPLVFVEAIRIRFLDHIFRQKGGVSILVIRLELRWL